jgi:uncharacterized protein YjbJ (UPF0337 family)
VSDEKKQRDRDNRTDPAHVREAKGAAQEAIGKLLGDDQAVRAGRSEQQDAAKRERDDDATPPRPRRDTKNSKQEQE